MVKRTTCLILICAFMLCLAGCQRQSRQTVFAMDTVMDLQIWGKDSQKGIQEIKTLLLDMDENWSAMKPNSIVGQLNRGKDVKLTQEQQSVLEKAKELCERTGGCFDPMLRNVLLTWGFYNQDHRVPSAEELQQAKKEKHWDLGGMVKGYAGQQAAEYLQSLNVSHAILNLGGNIQTYGNKPDGTPWSIGIQNPTGGDYIGTVSVVGTMSVVTSGDYQRDFEKDGVRYHHILDPKTGMPANSGIRAVTVICRDGLTADCLSTALFVMGLEKGSEFWRQSDDFEAVFIAFDGSVYATEGAALSGCEYEVIARED